MKLKRQSGFTLLEIIIVIIIIGVLASLALPRFFKTVSFAKSAEALTNLGVIRGGIDRCFLQTTVAADCNDMSELDIADPTATPGANFSYVVTSAADRDNYVITATGLTSKGIAAGSTIVMTNTAGLVTKTGSGDFVGIK